MHAGVIKAKEVLATMKISKEAAIEIAKQNTSKRFNITITDVWDERWKPYPRYVYKDCWFLTLLPAEPTGLHSSHLMVISKDTGEIFFSGDANDEG